VDFICDSHRAKSPAFIQYPGDVAGQTPYSYK
jgi:hypothetical protein